MKPYLNRSARVECVNVVRPSGEGTDGIFCEAEERVQVLVESLAHGGVKRPKNSRRAAAVALHAGHCGLSLKNVQKVMNF